MSMLICATIESRGTVGLSVNQRRPAVPDSSPVCQTNRIDRLGRPPPRAIASAISSRPIEPDPSSSAPLTIESSRAGRIARRLSRIFRIRAACSAGGSPPRRRLLAAASPSYRPEANRGPPRDDADRIVVGAEGDVLPRATRDRSLPGWRRRWSRRAVRTKRHIARRAGRYRPGGARPAAFPKILWTVAVGRKIIRGGVMPGGAGGRRR